MIGLTRPCLSYQTFSFITSKGILYIYGNSRVLSAARQKLYLSYLVNANRD